MKERDTRPRQSGMPAHLLPMYDRIAPGVMDAIRAIYVEVIASGGPAAELENDALSLQAEVIANAMVAFAFHLAELKSVPIELAAEIALRNVAERSTRLADGYSAMRQAEGATRQ